MSFLVPVYFTCFLCSFMFVFILLPGVSVHVIRQTPNTTSTLSDSSMEQAVNTGKQKHKWISFSTFVNRHASSAPETLASAVCKHLAAASQGPNMASQHNSPKTDPPFMPCLGSADIFNRYLWRARRVSNSGPYPSRILDIAVVLTHRLVLHRAASLDTGSAWRKATGTNYHRRWTMQKG